ncbi:MAG: hypothetical protein CME06_13540 [Gemmatimonadetes bacterium]|nr:hypothetical protein [Gemmatimonadota bacterium]
MTATFRRRSLESTRKSNELAARPDIEIAVKWKGLTHTDLSPTHAGPWSGWAAKARWPGSRHKDRLHGTARSIRFQPRPIRLIDRCPRTWAPATEWIRCGWSYSSTEPRIPFAAGVVGFDRSEAVPDL